MTERSTSDSLGNVSWIQKAALQLYRRNVPLLHTARRPGYKATTIALKAESVMKGYTDIDG